MTRWGRIEPVVIAGVATALVVLPPLVGQRPGSLRPGSLRDTAVTLLLLVGAVALAWWRSAPRVVAVTALTAALLAVAIWPEHLTATGLVVVGASCAVLALAWSGPAAWCAMVCLLGYLAVFIHLSGAENAVAVLVFSLPPHLAATALRLRRETEAALAARATELEHERDLYAEIVLRHERARIASELHDIVGHAVSVMVVQAAAGQRLVGVDPAGAHKAFSAIARSARLGGRDLERLVELLEADAPGAAAWCDLSIVDEVVDRAVRNGLHVACRLVGVRRPVPAGVAHLAHRVVQEGLTNVMRHAPGSQVRITLDFDSAPTLLVRVENDAGPPSEAPVLGTGRGLLGLRERVQAAGGRFSAGTRDGGGWALAACLPVGPAAGAD